MTLRNGLHCAGATALVLLTAFGAGARDIKQDATEGRILQVEDMTCATMVVPQDPKETLVSTVKQSGKTLGGFLKSNVEGIFRGTQEDIDVEQGKKDVEATYRAELKRGNWLPMSTEVEYGRRTHELMVDTLLDRDSKLGKELYPRADALLDEIKRGIDGSHDYDFKLFIREESTLNAMALPGGFLYLDVGLLKQPEQYDKARFALGHEVGHVLQRHETRELQGLIVDSYRDTKELKLAIAKSKREQDQAVALLKNVKISKDKFVRHTIDQELQADACAARLIFNAYPGGKELSASAKAFIGSLPAAKAAEPQPSPEFPSMVREIVTLPADRHPTSTERTQHLHKMQVNLTASLVKQPG